MAVVTEAAGTAALSAHTGPFGALARLQYSALASMRWAMFRNSLRTNQGTMELGARTLSFVLYAIMGLGLGAGLGGGAYAIVANDKLAFLPALFWVVFVLWQILPVSLASFQEQFDMGGLLRFPVSFGSFFLLHLIFGLVDISTILGGLSPRRGPACLAGRPWRCWSSPRSTSFSCVPSLPGLTAGWPSARRAKSSALSFSCSC